MKAAQQQAQEQEQEQEQDQELDVSGSESEHAREQHQVGNQAIQSRMSGASSAAPTEGGGGGLALRQEGAEHEGPSVGGDDEGTPAAPPSLDQIIASWNPKTKAGKDLDPNFIESLLAPEIPEPDLDWLRRVRALPATARPPVPTVASLLQPPIEATLHGFDPWAKAVARLLGHDPISRALAVLLVHAPSCLQDPYGRPLHGRVYRASLGVWALLDTSVGTLDSHDPRIAFLDFLLDLSSQREAVREAKQRHFKDDDRHLPQTKDLTLALLRPNETQLKIQSPDPTVQQHLKAVLTDLMNLPAPQSMIPSEVREASVERQPEEDPLGLDDVLTAFTGPQPDPQEASFQTAIESAEKIGSSCVNLRIQTAGMLAAFGRSCGRWSHGPPVQLLVAIASHVDLKTRDIFELLIEISNAGRDRTIPFSGLRNGLRRAARQSEDLQNETLEAVGRVLAGLLPTPPQALPQLPLPNDPISNAWADGSLFEALAWAQALPASPTRDLVSVLLECQLSPPAPDHVERLLAGIRLAEQLERPYLARALEVICATTLLWLEPSDHLKSLVQTQKTHGQTQRHGFAYAAATLWESEASWRAGEVDASREVRASSGGVLFHMGSPASLDALARWTAPESDL